MSEQFDPNSPATALRTDNLRMVGKLLVVAALMFALLVICGLVLSMLWRKVSAKSD